MASIQTIPELKINYLTQEQYNTALLNGEIHSDELYFTPGGAELILSTVAPSNEKMPNGTIWVQYID